MLATNGNFMPIKKFPTTASLADSMSGDSIDAHSGLVEVLLERKIAPGQRRSLVLAGRIALIYVVDGILAISRAGQEPLRVLPGEVARAAGIESLDYANGSRGDPLRVLEVCCRPDVERAPGVTQRYFPDDDKANALCLMASKDGQGGALESGADLKLFVTALGRWETVLHELEEGRAALATVVRGSATINSEKLESGWSAAISQESELRISGNDDCEVLLLDVCA